MPRLFSWPPGAAGKEEKRRAAKQKRNNLYIYIRQQRPADPAAAGRAAWIKLFKPGICSPAFYILIYAPAVIFAGAFLRPPGAF